MQRGVTALLVAQFLSAFGDNAILFAAIGMVLAAEQTVAWYIPALQAVFPRCLRGRRAMGRPVCRPPVKTSGAA